MPWSTNPLHALSVSLAPLAISHVEGRLTASLPLPLFFISIATYVVKEETDDAWDAVLRIILAEAAQVSYITLLVSD